MCRAIRGDRADENCGECLPPLRAENEDAVRIYLRCQRQLIFAGGGMGPDRMIDINHLAVHRAMALYKVRNRRECFEKVCMLAAKFIGEQGEEDLAPDL